MRPRTIPGSSGRPRPLRLLGDPALTEPCQEVTAFDGELARLVEDMYATMYAADGVGLAANQIGVPLRVFVYDCPDDGQLAAARLGITSTLVAWFVGSLLVVYVDDVQAFALRGANLAHGTAVTLLLGGAACMVIAVVLWFDSSPSVMHARRLRQSAPLLAGERRDP